MFNLIQCKRQMVQMKEVDETNIQYFLMTAHPATGILYVTANSPNFISGHLRLRGRGRGQYPYKYLEMINSIFGKEDNTIEVCSGSVRGRGSSCTCFTVDINPETRPDLVADAQILDGVSNNEFSRWRCDPPYNENTAQKMYRTNLPVTGELLKAGARVCRIGSLLFLLLGPQNYQWCPPGVKRIGWIAITVVPNNELRALHIFYKFADRSKGSYNRFV